MWEFIKYCLKCAALVIARGYTPTPDWVTWIDILVGLVTYYILGLMFCGILYVIACIMRFYYKHKKNNGPK